MTLAQRLKLALAIIFTCESHAEREQPESEPDERLPWFANGKDYGGISISQSHAARFAAWKRERYRDSGIDALLGAGRSGVIRAPTHKVNYGPVD